MEYEEIVKEQRMKQEGEINKLKETTRLENEEQERQWAKKQKEQASSIAGQSIVPHLIQSQPHSPLSLLIEIKKMTKHQDLKNEVRRSWKLKNAKVVPVIVGAMGMMMKNLTEILNIGTVPPGRSPGSGWII